MFFKDESEIDEDEIKNLPILQDLNEVDESSSGRHAAVGDLSSIYYSAHQSAINMTTTTMDTTTAASSRLNNLSAISSAAAGAPNSTTSSYWSFNATTNNNPHSSSRYYYQTKKRIKAPESLKSPLTPWCNSAEPNWKAFINDDLAANLGDLPTPSASKVNITNR